MEHKLGVFIVQHPYENADVGMDLKRSLKKSHPSLQAAAVIDDPDTLLQECAAGRIDRVWMRSIADLAADRAKAIQTLSILAQLGIQIYSEKEQFDSEAYGLESIIEMLTILDQSFSEDIKPQPEQVSDPRERSWITGEALYGYYKSQTNHWEIEPTQAEKIVVMFQMACCGCNYEAMLQKVWQMEQERPTGKKWSTDSLCNLFKQNMYSGDHIRQKCRKTVLPDGTIRYTKGRGKEYTEVLRNHHAPIVSKEVLEIVQKMQRARLFYSVRVLYTEQQIDLLKQAWGIGTAEWGKDVMEQYLR